MHPQSTTRKRHARQSPQERVCEYCGQVFVRRACDIRRSAGRYCSRACALAPRCLPITERFWQSVAKTDTCWLWTGGVGPRGYGSVTVNQRVLKAHRVAWEIAAGEPPPVGMPILHTCDTPACVRNDDQGTYEVAGVLLPRWGHLVLGTQTLNMTDMFQKRRNRRGDQRGERSGTAKLTAATVRAIRARGAAGERAASLARAFGVSHKAITNILRRQSWAHLE
jgi:hypothetical protein